MPVIIDATMALQPLQVVVPPLAKIVACSLINKLQALPQSAANGIVNLKAINVFFPTPFPQNAILIKENSSPLALILTALNTGIKHINNHINNHQNNTDFNEDDVNTHIELFIMWCMEVYQATVPKTCFSVDPDDGELAAFGIHRYTKHINPLTTTMPTGLPSTTSNVVRSLAASITCTHKEAEHQNQLHREQLDFTKDKEAKQKNKYEKWHETSRHLVLNAASNKAAKFIPPSYLRIINSKTVGMADRELQSQMRILGHNNAGFAHGLAVSLYNGDILWSSANSPSNLSPFTVFELEPLSSAQGDHCLQLHLLVNNMEGKSLEDIKASQKQEVKVPEMFKELVQLFVFYSSIASCLFREKSTPRDHNHGTHPLHPLQQDCLQDSHHQRQGICHQIHFCH